MEFRLLGPMEALSGAGPVEMGPPKQRALLAALLLQPNENVATDEPVEMSWADQPLAPQATRFSPAPMDGFIVSVMPGRCPEV